MQIWGRIVILKKCSIPRILEHVLRLFCLLFVCLFVCELTITCSTSFCFPLKHVATPLFKVVDKHPLVGPKRKPKQHSANVTGTQHRNQIQ